MQSIAVFCGSSSGKDPRLKELAADLGRNFAKRGITLVYGAGNIGLMGIMADAALEAGGKVVGAIPFFMKEKEVCHTDLTELFTVESMHERKHTMAEKADAFITLPGGFGTLDELFEILTWKQIQLHFKPVGLLNWNGYYDHLLAHIDKMIEAGFLKEVNRNLLTVANDLDTLLYEMEMAPKVFDTKWLDRS
ncbi:MAG: TIGR00730 family Rossman fold protein [Saprospirales bacterium]|nr:TIGR00730 family Rossman fold protein [Saprospirales bacterium]